MLSLMITCLQNYGTHKRVSFVVVDRPTQLDMDRKKITATMPDDHDRNMTLKVGKVVQTYS